MQKAKYSSTTLQFNFFCQIGVDYADDPRGHRLANRAEYNKVSDLFPDLDPDAAWAMIADQA